MSATALFLPQRLTGQIRLITISLLRLRLMINLPLLKNGGPMNATPSRDCSTCPGRMICHCLQVTEDVIVHAVSVLGVRTVKEIRSCTGAGDGCTACHRRLKQYLECGTTTEVVR
ncbi:MAG: (2Fe-2S)-binding protein [Planctomycetia bacterium]|nr:(2Fe-2S)-binding protein [Planctomycetia bacterium]